MSSDFDQRVRELLRDAVNVLPREAGLVDRIEEATVYATVAPHTEPADATVRRRRWLTPILASAAVLAVVVAVTLAVTIGGTHRHTPPTVPTPTPTPSVSLTASPSPTPTPTHSTSSPAPVVPVGTAVPAGFTAVAVSFVDDQLGFAIGDAPCSGGAYCPTLLRTRDGGVHWQSIPAPSGLVAVRHAGYAPSCYASNCADHVVFADQGHGYLWNQWGTAATVQVTSDGGATWTADTTSAGAIVDLVVTNDVAVRTLMAGNGTPQIVQTAPLGSTAWRNIQLSPQPYLSRLAANASSVYMLGTNVSTTGNYHHPQSVDLFRSTDGTSWTQVSTDPCTPSPNIGGSVSLAPDGAVVLTCEYFTSNSPIQGHDTVRISTDNGRSFGPEHTIANSTFDLSGVDASSPSVGVLAGSATDLTATVMRYRNDPSPDKRVIATMEHSTDGGASWQPVPGQSSWQPGGMPSASFGYLLSLDRTGVLITSNAGATWTTRPFA